jgi:hypothetical protein
MMQPMSCIGHIDKTVIWNRADPEIATKSLRNSIPTPGVIHTAMDQDQIRFSIVSPIPEVQFQPVRIEKL